jgi:two-component system, chemotaxis family, protein-glutamate methylesterase/glutaminase
MNFERKLYSKWISSDHQESKQMDFNVINSCVLVCEDELNQVIGLAVFETQEINQIWLDKLAARKARAEFKGKKFKLYLPKYLEIKFTSLNQNVKNLTLHYTSFVHVVNRHGLFFIRSRLRVMSVDDSPVLLKFLQHTMNEMGYIDVVDTESDSTLAIEKIKKFKPDVITMDIQMPNKTGVEIVSELLAQEFFPILMVSNLNIEESFQVIDALEQGAFDYIQKPKLEDKFKFKTELELKLLLAVAGGTQSSLLRNIGANTPRLSTQQSYPDNLIWCLGSSTGGTQALTHIFTNMPSDIPPTLVTQHIPAGFSKAFADSLNKLCPFTVKEAEDGEPLLANHVYIAPGAFQMSAERQSGRLVIRIKDLPPVNRFKPSVDYLFLELAKLTGLEFKAGLLTGMGKDGVEGLLKLKSQGAYTFAQDEKSSVVFGMPRAAIEMGAASETIALNQIAQTLVSVSTKVKRPGPKSG